jgi:tetratricopeptide (TPR) repeat protein
MRSAILSLYVFWAVVPMPPVEAAGPDPNPKPTDYQSELKQLDTAISMLQEGKESLPADAGRAMRYVHLLFRRASLTGSLSELEASGTRIDEAIRQLGPSEDLELLRADLHFKSHKLTAVRDDLGRIVELASGPRFKALMADLDFQEGRYEEARSGYEDNVRRYPTWDNLARLAYFRSKMGEIDEADRLYARAEEEITAKEMRSFAWVELQRGLLAFGRGRTTDASAHYEKAGRAYTGYWLVDEYNAERLGSMGKFDEAAALYEKVLAIVPRPEIQQALGDLYVYMGKPDRARVWHDKALVAYLESVGRGEVHYFHHLASFYADVREDGAEAEKWARKDLELRANYATRESLAWAQFRAGRIDEALDEIKRSLAFRVVDAHLFYHAAMIHLAAGQTEEGKRFLKRTAEINPRYDEFHVHR